MVKVLSSNEGDVGSIPDQGTMIPHAMGYLSLCVSTTSLSPCILEPANYSKRSHMLQLRPDTFRN